MYIVYIKNNFEIMYVYHKVLKKTDNTAAHLRFFFTLCFLVRTKYTGFSKK